MGGKRRSCRRCGIAGHYSGTCTLGSKECSVCGLMFGRLREQVTRDFNRQRTCLRPDCMSVAMGAPRRVVEASCCPSCGRQLTRGLRESVTSFAARIFCNHQCQGKGRTRKLRPCNVCGEDTGHAAAHTCSDKCRGIARSRARKKGRIFDVLGVGLTALEISEVAEVAVGTVYWRHKNKRDVLTGEPLTEHTPKDSK